MKGNKKYKDSSLALQYFDPYSGEKPAQKTIPGNTMGNYMLDDIAGLLDVPKNKNVRPFHALEKPGGAVQNVPRVSPFIKKNTVPQQSAPPPPALPMQPMANPVLSFEAFVARQQAQQSSPPIMQSGVKPPKKISNRERRKQEKALQDFERQRKRIEKTAARKIRMRRFLSALIILGFLSIPLVIVMVLNSTVFIAKNIRIEGISKYTDDDILTLGGIKRNQSLQSINVERVVHKINNAHNLRVMDFRFVYPDGIYIRVQEKTPVAIVTSNGFVYYLDKYGDVLEKLSARKNEDHYVEVKNCVMYQPTSSTQSQMKNQWQKDAYVEVMNAVVSLGVTNEFVSLSILKDDNIYLTTKDNFVVNLGKLDNIGMKIANALAVREYVAPGFRAGGLIDVSIPDKPVFSNEDNKVLYERKYYLEPSPSTVYNTIEEQNSAMQDAGQEAVQQPENAPASQEGTTQTDAENGTE